MSNLKAMYIDIKGNFTRHVHFVLSQLCMDTEGANFTKTPSYNFNGIDEYIGNIYDHTYIH